MADKTPANGEGIRVHRVGLRRKGLRPRGGLAYGSYLRRRKLGLR